MTHTPRDIPTRVVFITGPSGAGRSTAINALEDLGFEAIDNMPLHLIPRLLDGPALDRPLALGTDARNRDYTADRLIDIFDNLRQSPDITPDLVYLDCAPDMLQRRFSETRRRHPLAPDDHPMVGILRERDLLVPLRQHAGVVIDTTTMTPHDLRARMSNQFSAQGFVGISVTVMSFSYRKGIPVEADMVFDCRFLRNPHWDTHLRPLTGFDAPVCDYITQDPRFSEFWQHLSGLFDLLLPAFRDEGKSHLTLAFGCTGGRHRSVAVAQMVAGHLAQADWRVATYHRETPMPDQTGAMPSQVST